jgi:hypothetical protein
MEKQLAELQEVVKAQGELIAEQSLEIAAFKEGKNTNAVSISDETKTSSVTVPEKSFTVKKQAYRFKVAVLYTEDEKLVTAEILDKPEKLAAIVKDYPNCVEKV